jgi:hypothetical protein
MKKEVVILPNLGSYYRKVHEDRPNIYIYIYITATAHITYTISNIGLDRSRTTPLCMKKPVAIFLYLVSYYRKLHEDPYRSR